MFRPKDTPAAAPLDGQAVQLLENALFTSPDKKILLEINHAMYQLSREGRWYKFSQLTKKRTIKRAVIYETLTELYNTIVHGQIWRITGPAAYA